MVKQEFYRKPWFKEETHGKKVVSLNPGKHLISLFQKP